MSETLDIQVIAHVETPFVERFGTPRQPGLVESAWGRIVFLPEFQDEDFFRGLEKFSHIWLSFLFDRTADAGYRKMVRPPRLGGNTKLGVFATRSPYRPNALGLSAVKLERVEKTIDSGVVLHVSGVDLTNGTPLVDVRPYVVYTDSLPYASSGFAADAPEKMIVRVEDDLLGQWSGLSEQSRKVIEETLSLNPGPAYQESGRVYKLELCGMHIEWTRASEEICIHVLTELKE